MVNLNPNLTCNRDINNDDTFACLIILPPSLLINPLTGNSKLPD